MLARSEVPPSHLPVNTSGLQNRMRTEQPYFFGVNIKCGHTKISTTVVPS